MVFGGYASHDGVWHCPFSPAWVEKMKQAAKHCDQLTDDFVEKMLSMEVLAYELPKMDFLDEEQDARGLPLSYCKKEEERYGHWRSFFSIYDYSTVPDVVVTNGDDDWPLQHRGGVMMA
jgi:hypothetical protein